MYLCTRNIEISHQGRYLSFHIVLFCFLIWYKLIARLYFESMITSIYNLSNIVLFLCDQRIKSLAIICGGLIFLLYKKSFLLVSIHFQLNNFQEAIPFCVIGSFAIELRWFINARVETLKCLTYLNPSFVTPEVVIYVLVLFRTLVRQINRHRITGHLPQLHQKNSSKK